MEKLVALCKRRGFIYPGSEIYGGLANTWDYGPYGVLLKKNIKEQWWKTFVQERDDMVGLDAAILMNPKTWEASGHVTNFSDPLMDCKNCKERVRGDKLIEEKFGIEAVAGKSLKEIGNLIEKHKIPCPKCGKCNFTEARSFNLMFETHQGVIKEDSALVYLRPETAQGIFVNFKNIIDTTRVKVPFGIAQIGKAFRNEITPGNFTFRTREFEQMEIEFFIKPGTEKEWFEHWCEQAFKWFTDLGISKDKLRFRAHEKDELSHYSTMTKDIEFKFPFGKAGKKGEKTDDMWGELTGIAYRGNFDLSQHIKFSGQKLEYRDSQTNEVYIPHVIEPSFGADRAVLAFLINAYVEENLGEEGERTVMKFHPKIAPIKIAIFPLSKQLGEKAKEIYDTLKKDFMCEYDDSGSIGKRYRRQDEIGTPFCVTVDFETEGDQSVTIRNRDSMEQDRIPVAELREWFWKKI
ncbi:glycine--tRNA ligase [Candidatus Peregrinibacteria bacterium RIFOXYB2_FULL_32_7]|nr:MAG: glycine--tRNA ligase [Candidatus Peregrinibacteria bacterium RIFOXYB2_FULL_32_7]